MAIGTIASVDGSNFIVAACPECGAHYMIPHLEYSAALHLRDNTTKNRMFWCPNGHQWRYLSAAEAEARKERVAKERANTIVMSTPDVVNALLEREA